MLEFKKTSEFSKGILYHQLVDAYSFNETLFSGNYIDYEMRLKK